MKELHSASEASIGAASGGDAAASEADDKTSGTDINSKSLEKYAPVIAQFKVCIIHCTPMLSNNVNINKLPQNCWNKVTAQHAAPAKSLIN